MDNWTKQKLMSYGFTQQEIGLYEYILSNGGKITPMFLRNQLGLAEAHIKRLTYLHKMYQGLVSVVTEDEMIKHCQKMTGATREDAREYVYRQNLANGYGAKNYTKEELKQRLKKTEGKKRKITMDDLATSTIMEVPRVAVVQGISNDTFKLWNSNRYKGKEALYKVVKTTPGKVTIITDKKPVIKYGGAKEIKDQFSIKGLSVDKRNVIVEFDKDYCKLCNRYIIVASLRNPDKHFGKYEIICNEGTTVYVYATSMGTAENVRYGSGTQRVYDYGVLPGEIKGRLSRVAESSYKRLQGVRYEYVAPTSKFVVIPVEKETPVNRVEDNIEY